MSSQTSDPTGPVAVVPVRNGRLPVGGLEVVAEADGAAVLVGSGCVEAADELTGIAADLRYLERSAYEPAIMAHLLADALAAHRVIILPGSPDGRDLAPRLAHVLDRPVVGGAVRVGSTEATVSRGGGLTELSFDVPFVATLQPGVRSAVADPALTPAVPSPLTPDAGAVTDSVERGSPEPELLELLEPDPATMDLGDAHRIVAGGVGLGTDEIFGQLHRLGELLGASVGATRVVTDLGWAGFERQIGTTGVLVDPDLYLAFGISGAVQHVSGLGQPEHIVSVNLDPSCPMMSMADLAVVSDAPRVIEELMALLEAS